MLLPYSVILAVFAVTMALTGRFVETHGPRKITIIGCILAGLGWLFASTASSTTMLSVMYYVMCPDLRAIAMREHEPVARTDQADDLGRRPPSVCPYADPGIGLAHIAGRAKEAVLWQLLVLRGHPGS